MDNEFKAGSRLYASVSWITSASANDMSPVRRQAIAWTSANLLSIFILEQSWTGKQIQIKIQQYAFFQVNAFENVVCKMSSILFRL